MSQGSGARILVVDDEPALVRAVETNLRKHDFRVERAATGAEALEAYSTAPAGPGTARPWLAGS